MGLSWGGGGSAGNKVIAVPPLGIPCWNVMSGAVVAAEGDGGGRAGVGASVVTMEDPPERRTIRTIEAGGPAVLLGWRR